MTQEIQTGYEQPNSNLMPTAVLMGTPREQLHELAHAQKTSGMNQKILEQLVEMKTRYN